MPAILWPLIAYLAGSISSAILVSKLLGLADPRTVGSGNPGTTNVLRNGGKAAAFLTLVGDIAKGLIPVLAAQHFDASIPIIALTALAAFLGHLFPLFYGFKGGKGVATAIGVYFALDYWLGAVFILTWIVVAVVSRYSSLAALIASAVVGMASFAIFNQPEELQLIGAVFAIVALTYERHRINIARLKDGTESKIGESKGH